MKRRYMINVSASRKHPTDVMTGDVMCCPQDAARNYAGLWLPGYEVRSIRYSCVKTTKAAGSHSLFVAEALNQETCDSKLLYVREIESEDTP